MEPAKQNRRFPYDQRVEIREILAPEYEEASRVATEAFAEYEPVAGDRAWWPGWFRRVGNVEVRAKNAPVLVAVENRRVVGTIMLEVDQDGEGLMRSPDAPAHLRMLAVDMEYRRQGIGRQLALVAIDRARKTGRSGVSLYAAEYMMASHPLYESLGFERDTRHDVQDGDVIEAYYLLTF